MTSVQAIVNLIENLSSTDQQIVINNIIQLTTSYNALENNNPDKIKNGVKMWLDEKGSLHRTEKGLGGNTLPAEICPDGSTKHCVHGDFHRIDTDANGQTLPAFCTHREKQWCRYGKFHRKEFINGELQPAMIDGIKKLYWIDGRRVDPKYDPQYINEHNDSVEFTMFSLQINN